MNITTPRNPSSDHVTQYSCGTRSRSSGWAMRRSRHLVPLGHRLHPGWRLGGLQLLRRARGSPSSGPVDPRQESVTVEDPRVAGACCRCRGCMSIAHLAWIEWVDRAFGILPARPCETAGPSCNSPVRVRSGRPTGCKRRHQARRHPGRLRLFLPRREMMHDASGVREALLALVEGECLFPADAGQVATPPRESTRRPR
jgi:hypothetical protein